MMRTTITPPTVTVSETPDVCVKALDAADRIQDWLLDAAVHYEAIVVNLRDSDGSLISGLYSDATESRIAALSLTDMYGQLRDECEGADQ